MAKKLLISFLVVLTIGVTITGFFSFQFTKNFYLRSLEDKLTSNGRVIAESFIKEYAAGNGCYDDFARHYSEMSSFRVTIISEDGRVLGESDMDSLNMGDHSERQEVQEALKGRVGKSYRYSSTEKANMLYVAVPAKTPDDSTVVIRLSVPVTEIQKIQGHFLVYILLAVLAGLFISSIIAYTSVNSITRPIKEMTYLSSSIAQGRYDKRINLRVKYELGQLASAFNNMAEKLQTVISELSDKKTKLEAILKSMGSGVIAVDNSGKIILANPTAYKIFGINEYMIGRHVLDVSMNAGLEEIIKKQQEKVGTLEAGGFEVSELKISYPEKRILRVKAAPIRDDEGDRNLGVVVVMEDITEIRQLEQMKSEFAANVSHELKTPLTSIKGFTETLKNGAVNDENMRGKFLDIIDMEAERLTRLINDIMTLSDLENRKADARLEKIDMNSILYDVKDVMETLAVHKNINIDFVRDDSNPNIMGSHDRVKQLMINLIDNAIKYTPEGGKVRTAIYHDGSYVYIEVSDTGIGIPKEHIPRLFERFYRVDKSRSRSMGGTGLGLAIVKHIVSSMDGKIEVESEPGRGSKFTVMLPKAN